MPTFTWEQEPTSRWLQFRFDQLGRSFFLKQPDIINQLCLLTDRDVVVHLDQQPYTASFWGNLMPLPQRPGIRRKSDNPPGSLSLAGDVCTIEHHTGGRWLGPEGWQTYPHYIRLVPADAPARTIVAQTCRKCGHRNRATSRYCTQCGHNEFDPI